MSWTKKVKGLEEKLSEACAAFDGHDARLIFTAKRPVDGEDQRLLGLPALEPLEHRPSATMLARLKLPVLDYGDVLAEVSIVGPEVARSKFAELVGMAGLLIPSDVQAELDRFQPAQGRMTERGRFLAWLWRLESNRLAEQDEPGWMDLGDGQSFVFGIREPFQLARLVLRCFRENPGGQFEIPTEGRGCCSHSPDFRSVNWFGATYEFTPMEAACVKVLWEAWEQGSPVIGDSTILELAESNAERLGLVFRDNQAWGAMIVEGSTKGTHRLADRPTS